ncbi:hypothetical protein ACFL5U_01885 [Candidatus Margulisiibacteriota bacterium]
MPLAIRSDYLSRPIVLRQKHRKAIRGLFCHGSPLSFVAQHGFNQPVIVRQQQVTRIADLVMGGQNVLYIGEYRIGKSAILAGIMQRAQAEGRERIYIDVVTRATGRASNKVFLERLTWALVEHLPYAEKLKLIDPADPLAILEKSAEPPLLLFNDFALEAGGYREWRGDFHAYLSERLTRCGGVAMNAIWRTYRGFLDKYYDSGSVHLEYLSLLTEEEARALLRSSVDVALYEKLEAFSSVIAKASGRPVIIKMLWHELLGNLDAVPDEQTECSHEYFDALLQVEDNPEALLGGQSQIGYRTQMAGIVYGDIREILRRHINGEKILESGDQLTDDLVKLGILCQCQEGSRLVTRGTLDTHYYNYTEDHNVRSGLPDGGFWST